MQRVLAAVRRRFPRVFCVAVFRVLAAVRLASSARAVHDQSIRETRDEQVHYLHLAFWSMTHPMGA